MTQGKGSRVRPTAISRAEWERRWASAFPKKRKGQGPLPAIELQGRRFTKHDLPGFFRIRQTALDMKVKALAESAIRALTEDGEDAATWKRRTKRRGKKA